MKKIAEALRNWLGLDYQTAYVRDYFYTSNMRAATYMSVVYIALELWVTLRMLRTIFLNGRQSELLARTEHYLANYAVLFSAAVLMLLYALRFFKRSPRLRLIALLPGALCTLTAFFEVWILFLRSGARSDSRTRINDTVLLAASLLLILLSGLLLIRRKDVRKHSIAMIWVFAVIGINFGMYLSSSAYERGEQVFAFLTMIMFVLCLLTWRPVIGISVLTLSYILFFGELNHKVAFNNAAGLPGVSESTTINGFTLWISMVMICIANYRKVRAQALKDEHLEKVNAHLSEISVRDELTGIHNMFYFRTEAEKLLNYVTTDRDSVVYLFLDIENFRSYNEKYGFQEGSTLLTKIAGIIEKAFRGSLVSRFSDDHFVVLTREDGCTESVAAVSEEIRKAQREVQLSLKCGAYKPSDGETDPSLACDRARFACNSIKKHFRRTFRYYDKSLEDRFQLKAYIVNHIDAAIEHGDIKVYYQPVVSTADGCICGLEALARWEDPTYGLLPPGTFIEILEEYRQIYKLDRCIIEQVCRDYREAADSGEPFAPVSLNFSRLDFELCDIVGDLTQLVRKYSVPPEYLDIEITESALSDQQEFLPDALRSLRRNGYKIWLDDFGSGYSSLNVLKDYHFDVLKIDMNFLSGFGSNEKTMPILSNIILLTKELHMISLTEGVETKEQFAFLRSIGCDRAQGYLFSRPVPLKELRAEIRTGRISVSPEFMPGKS